MYRKQMISVSSISVGVPGLREEVLMAHPEEAILS